MIDLVLISIINIFAKLLKFGFEIGTNYFVDKETYGYFAILLSYVLIYSRVVSFGLPNIMIREFPKYKSIKNKSFILFNTLPIISLVTLLCYLIIYFLKIKYVSEYWQIPFIVFSLGVISVYSSYFRSHGKVKTWIFFQDILWYIFYFIGLTLLFYTNDKKINISEILQLYFISIILTAIILLIVIKLKEKLLLITKISTKKIKYLAEHSLPVLFTGFTYLILARIDVIMLGEYVDIKLVGEYNIIVRITIQVLFFQQVIASYYYPKLAKKFALKENYQNIAIFNTKYVLLSFLSVLIVGIILFIWFKYFGLFNLLHIVHKDKLFDVFIIFVITQITYSFIGFYGYILLYIHKQKIEYINNVIILAVGIILNLILIPYCGVSGAALASAIAIILGNILEIFQVKYYTNTFFINFSVKRLL
jgi:O-antigen/teichoic acid export membrane protein